MANIQGGDDYKDWRPSNLAGGLCLDDLPYKIADNQSPTCQNVWYNDRIITKRWGQDWVNETEVSANPVLSMHKELYKTYIVFACGTKLYKQVPSTGVCTEIMTGLTANKGSFFVFNDNLYYINGANYVVWTGTGSATNVVGKTPTVLINCTPAGVGNVNEGYNRISAGFTVTFNGNGADTVYTLPQTGLDATTAIASIGGVSKTEGVDFTVNRTTGKVTWGVAPTSGTNNVSITAYKTNSTYTSSILNCEYSATFGGENQGTEGGTRIFLADNSTNYVYWSGLQDPTYFPDNNYNLIGSNDEGIRGFGKQYGLLFVFKPSKLYSMEYSFDGTTVRFITREVNSSIGCDCPYTIQLIDNKLVWLKSNLGVCTLVSSVIQDERNVQVISQNINGTRTSPGLLSESLSDLQAATSVDMKGKYWLCVDDKVYLWDYEISPYVFTGNAYADGKRLSWWYFTNINANCWCVNYDTLYFGDRTTGKTVKFVSTFDDFGEAIEAWWRSLLNPFGLPDYRKTINIIEITTKTSSYSIMEIRYYTEKEGEAHPIIDAKPIVSGSFSWATTTWATWTWSVINYLKTYRRKPKLKKRLVFAIEVYNNDVGKDLAISDLIVNYKIDGRVK